jgi:hypothetical protein
MSLQAHNFNMATTGNKKVMKSLMAEEEEFMEIDSFLGFSQKKAIGKAKEIAEKSSKKTSKSGEVICITIPQKENIG